VAEALTTTWLMEQHREIASTLQAALLPPRLPEIDGIGLAVRYWPAGAVTIVGGDFYDVFPLGGERWAIVIGDVCGSGPNAAAVTAIARHTMRAAAMHGAAGADALDWTNLALHAGNRDLFCTAVFSTVERTLGGWRFTSTAAGHPLPLLARADGEVSTVGELGSLLGVLPELELGTASVELRPGDTLIFYTDGDAQYDAKEAAGLVAAVTATTDIVQGYKIGRGDPWYRKVIGRVYHHVVKVAFRLSVRDTDCDFRLFRRSLFVATPLQSQTGVICVEMMRRFETAGARFVEVPVHHYTRPHGTSQFFRLPHIARAALQLGRLWVIATLGARWTTRIIVLPGAPLVRSGPYRFVDHPNYVIVALEIAVLPLAFGLVEWALVFSILNAAVLAVRIRAENQALGR
jgi:hypothetical protein